MGEWELVEGDTLVYTKVRNIEAREQLRQLLEEMPGVRINASLYEVSTADWEIGLWDEEVERIRDLIDPDTDTVILWRVIDGKLARSCVASRFN